MKYSTFLYIEKIYFSFSCGVSFDFIPIFTQISLLCQIRGGFLHFLMVLLTFLIYCDPTHHRSLKSYPFIFCQSYPQFLALLTLASLHKLPPEKKFPLFFCFISRTVSTNIISSAGKLCFFTELRDS